LGKGGIGVIPRTLPLLPEVFLLRANDQNQKLPLCNMNGCFSSNSRHYLGQNQPLRYFK
jgi:hypothetical protein